MRAPTKYGNRKTTIDGVTYASAKEGRRAQELKLLQRVGKISDLKTQPRYDLTVNGMKVCAYVADFAYFDHDAGKHVVEDVKSAATAKLPVFRIKSKLMKAVYGIEVRLA